MSIYNNENSYIIYKYKLEKDIKEKEKIERDKTSKEIDAVIKKIRENINYNVSANFLKYPNSWTASYISRIDNLINKVRESNNIDLAESLLTASIYMFGSNPNLLVSKKIIESLETDHRIDESAYLIKSDKIFNYALIACVFSIGTLSFLFFAINKYIPLPLIYTQSFFYIFLGALCSLLGSIVGWSIRKPQAYDLSSGKRRFDIQWALISAMNYPIVPCILGAMIGAALMTGVIPIKTESTIPGYIAIISFCIGYSDSYRSSIMKKLSSIDIK
ncbi:hypothetical protein [Acetobacter ascendens]|uniref:Uncharacterized protein n=1 Tax=Acetobacter ascendens TaxID=481146 RepID=A0A1Y0V234_9PROT|nr:hypothetical protein [Acetobacter ascendens]ARW11814.1 hypothetical protein S101447_02777 [Acetobacter ascendens]